MHNTGARDTGVHAYIRVKSSKSLFAQPEERDEGGEREKEGEVEKEKWREDEWWRTRGGGGEMEGGGEVEAYSNYRPSVLTKTISS